MPEKEQLTVRMTESQMIRANPIDLSHHGGTAALMTIFKDNRQSSPENGRKIARWSENKSFVFSGSLLTARLVKKLTSAAR
jgi:hypothetical protein